jgi:hypothetical protein
LYFDDKSTVDRAFSALAQYTEFDVFRRSEQPPYAHLGESERVGDLVVSAHPGLYFADTDLWPWYLRPLAVFGPDFETTPFLGAGLYSAHGYPPDTPGVQGVFYAWGNDIPKGRHLESIRMIDVNPTVTQLLGILPARLVDGAPIDALFAARSVAQMPKGSRGDLAVGSAEQPVHRLRRIKVVPP